MASSSGNDGNHSKHSIFLLGLLVIGLLAGPLWVETLHLDDRRYEYDRVEVTVKQGTLEYAPSGPDPGITISEDILCSEALVPRTCYLERVLTENQTVPTSQYTSDNPTRVGSRYRFVAGSDGLYRVDTVLNRSQGYVVENGSTKPVTEDSVDPERVLYRVELSLEPVAPTTVLERVAVDVDNLGPAACEAAQTGSTQTFRPVDVPETPVKLDDGSYYRVYLASERGPPETGRTAVLLLRYVAPIAGLLVGYWTLSEYRRSRAT